MTSEGRIPAIEGAHLLESLRASDFDIPSAIGELIDNSIEANAKNIHIKIADIPAGGKRTYSIINKIIVGDDGKGMDSQPDSTLHKCIRLGFSTRYNNREGIGRFGVGMTLAGIRFATKIEVYSKQKNEPWFYIDFDLKNPDDINEGIKPPIKKDIPEEYVKLVGRNSGTLVIWSGFDKIVEHDLHSDTYDDKLGAPESLDPYGLLNHWIGRTFRKFIWKDIRFFLNNKEIFSFDPLFINKEKNQFPQDPSAEITFPLEIPWDFRKTDDSGNLIELKSKINVKISILPEYYRKVSGKGGLPFKGRYIDDNQGISILRSDREVFYDEIPHFGETRQKKITWEDKDRWWGCEINFSPDLDEFFLVKNIKRGAIPIKSLKIELFRKIKPIRDEILKKVQEDWSAFSEEEERKKNLDEKGLPKTHNAAEEIGKETKIPIKPKVGVNIPENERESIFKELTRGLDEVERAQYIARFSSQPYMIIDQRWRGDDFFTTTYLDGKFALEYNLNHQFIEEIRDIQRKLKAFQEEGETLKLAENLNALIDILLVSFAQARQNYSDDEEYTVKLFLEDFLINWGRYLRNYTETYQKDKDKSAES